VVRKNGDSRIAPRASSPPKGSCVRHSTVLLRTDNALESGQKRQAVPLRSQSPHPTHMSPIYVYVPTSTVPVRSPRSHPSAHLQHYLITLISTGRSHPNRRPAPPPTQPIATRSTPRDGTQDPRPKSPREGRDCGASEELWS